MQQAADHLLGDNDFRNFCKMDVEHVLTFRCINCWFLRLFLKTTSKTVTGQLHYQLLVHMIT